MADKEVFTRSPIQRLEDRVDNLDRRVTVVETTLGDLRRENKAGFDALGKQLEAIHDEKAKWGEWARENLGRALKWCGIIVLAACGITQASSLVKLFIGGD